MAATEIIEGIAFDAALSVPEKEGKIISFLAEQDDRGVSAATECLLQTHDERVSEFAATYLQLIPGAQEEKTRAAERLRQAGPLARSAARLVPWLPESLVDAFIADYMADPEENSPRSAVLFTIGIFYPGRLRPYADRIDSSYIKQSLLSGSPDSLVDAFMARWREEEDIELLHSLALIRTEHAADAIASVRNQIEDPEDWECLLELAGRLPDSGKSSGLHPAFMGSVTDRSVSPHAMGGGYPGDVPICLECEAPSERILTLSAEALPFGLSQNPSFFWYTCDCGEMDSVTVRITPEGLNVYLGRLGPADKDSRLVPGERSLTLESHPNQTGVSLEAISGRSQHQVGGLPRWPSAETHPACPECRNFMPFLAAIDSGPTPFGPMGFSSSLFGFWCDNCTVSTTQIQY
ncbi:hypothetical protein YWIDRAFT_00966 [Streptomyces sp. SceaMP-e96]|uniref:hypothetical protein n=1 Tax=unclassified Streptomyces TaxID=2593676 RepID=UPI000823E820|nr:MULTISPECIES: hypothetical protein [unclassified Streptomyces]MYT11745.1 hypothetical protein [Streptomyces sp. SID4951]SCK11867.1 hypothetical protein YWIDRAFT_00966 [Streptomyces sp. SceaMP-e96]